MLTMQSGAYGSDALRSPVIDSYGLRGRTDSACTRSSKQSRCLRSESARDGPGSHSFRKASGWEHTEVAQPAARYSLLRKVQVLSAPISVWRGKIDNVSLESTACFRIASAVKGLELDKC